MTIEKETRTYRLHGTTSLLGSNPANPEVHSRYVAIKAASVEKAALEESMLPGAEELAEKLRDIKESGLTVFLRGNHGELVLGAHCIKGFLKAAFVTLKDQFSVGAAKSKVDNLVEFSVTLVKNEGTAKSKAITFEQIEAALDYGELKGLGQWRNSGRGSFTWERIG